MRKNNRVIQKQNIHIGPTGKKILLLLFAGTTLALTTRPDVAIRVIKQTTKAWQDINRRALRESVRRLYQSQLIHAVERVDGSVAIRLTAGGKEQALNSQLDLISIAKPPHWDGLWRVVMFDIPEQKRRGRNAFAAKLKELGFHPIQKSVFIFPYECKNEINFIVEAYDLSLCIQFLLVKEIDNAEFLKRRFNLK